MAELNAWRDPMIMINQMAALKSAIRRAHSAIEDEIDDIEVQWDGLRVAGGQREDHAAFLMTRLEPHLAGLRLFADKCLAQLKAMSADPFGREQQPVETGV